jgi:hypothetical protein
MLSPIKIVGQAIAYTAFAGIVGYFSASPAYTHLDPNLGLIRLSFSHAGQPVTECRRLTQEELNRLAPNMRRPTDCPRERVPLLVELVLEDKVIYREYLTPSGLSKDGASTAYQRFPVKPGRYKLMVRLRDSRRTSGFDWERQDHIEIRARQNFVIDFRAETGGFKFL